MSKTFAQTKKPASPEAATSKDEAPSPLSPVPLAVTGDRAAPSGSTGGPAPITLMRAYDADTPGRPRSNAISGPSGPVGRPRSNAVSGGRPAPQQEIAPYDGPYNNVGDGEQGGGEAPAHAYDYVSVEAGPEAPHVYDVVPDQDAPGQDALGGGGSHYGSNYGTPQDVPASNYGYSVIEEVAPQAEQLEREAAEQVEGGGPRAEAPKDIPAMRKHRAWMVALLGKTFEGEKGAQRGGLIDVARSLGTVIASQYNYIRELQQLSAGDHAGRQALLSALPANHPARVAPTLQDALEVMTKRYEDNLEKARREELPIADDGTVGDMSTRLVEYDEDDAAQARSAVLIGAGKLWRNDEAKTPVDTEASVTHHTGLGAEIFVVGESSDLHMASHKIGKFHHSSLLGGKPVAMAGEIKATNGKIDWISNKSGHYWPTMAQFQQFLHHLAKDGVSLDFPVHKMGPEILFPPGTTAQQLVDGVGVDGSADPKKGHDAVKTQTVIPAWIALITPAGVDQVIADNDWTMTTVDGTYLVKDRLGQPVADQVVRGAFKAAHPDKRARTEYQK